MGTPTSGDGELWARAVAGCSSSFGVLFDRHAKAIYNHCFRLTASWSTAEDLLQNTFMLAWRKRDRLTLEPHESALPWLLALATNVVRTERRSFARRMRLTRRAHVELPTADPADDVASRVDDERDMAELLDAVHALPRAQREALVLCLWSDVSYADASKVLGIKEVSVRARVSRARAALAATGPAPVATTITMEER